MEPPNAFLDYAYVGLPSMLGMDFSLGRIRTEGGESLDGLHSRRNFTSSTGISFYTGKATKSANELFGGRFSHGFGGRSKIKIGVSYVNESAGPDKFREETALDLRLHPFNRVILSGRSRIDLLTGTWTEHSYSIKIGPVRKASLLLDASLLDFGRNADQSLTVGAGIRYPISPHLAVRADMGKTDDPFTGITFSEGITFSSSFPAWNAGISVARREGANLNIVEMSAHAAKRSGPVEAFLNLRKILQDRFNRSNSNIASTTLGFVYDINPEYRLVADLEGTRNSYSHLDLRGFIKLEYRFGA